MTGQGPIRASRAESAVVLGAGGHAKVVVATLRAAGWNVVGLYDDAEALRGGTVLGSPVAGRIVDALGAGCRNAVVAIGDNGSRQRIATELLMDWLTVIHPRASVDGSVVVGPGAVFFAGGIVQPEAQVGAHTIVNTGAVVEHDCIIGPFAHIGPGARLGGGVRVGEGAFVGMGSTVIPGVRVGAWSTIGAGAVVIGEVEEGVVVVGVPARPTRRPR